MSRMEMIYIDSTNQARKTGVGAIMDTPAETWAAFLSTKRIAVHVEKARFLLDYYNRKGDLSATIPLDGAGYQRITGHRVLSDAKYRAIDAKFWKQARDEMKETQS